MRTLIRLILVLLVLAGAAIYLGLWPAPAFLTGRGSSFGTSGTIDPEKARERGAEIGGKAAVAADRLNAAAHDAQITTKIKAKMALDDTIRARSIDVSTAGDTVTLSGKVRSAAEHSRAVALARETAGVDRVVDRLVVER